MPVDLLFHDAIYNSGLFQSTMGANWNTGTVQNVFAVFKGLANKRFATSLY